jgi:hypothetical protein
VQRQLGNDWVISADDYHKDIENLLGVRETNIPFADRLTNMPSVTPINGFGPWYRGTYDAGILSFEKRISKRFTIGGSYAYVSENDDALNSNLGTSTLSAASGSFPTDSFVGVPPVVTDPGTTSCPSKTNANAAFFACNGNFVPKAGVFYNGPALDSGSSDFALRHTFEIHGLVNLPWKVQLSSLLRAQSGFHYTASAAAPIDQDGNGSFTGRDLKTARNAFNAPDFSNMDLRISKTWVIRERLHVQGMFEFFNLFNTGNAAAMQNQQGLVTFGTVSQWLPGRQGQVGLRLEF